jgi:hypothetical protein
MIRVTIELLSESKSKVKSVKVGEVLINSQGTRRDSNYDVSVREATHLLQEDLKDMADLLEDVSPRQFTIEHFDRGRGFFRLAQKCIEEFLRL